MIRKSVFFVALAALLGVTSIGRADFTTLANQLFEQGQLNSVHLTNVEVGNTGTTIGVGTILEGVANLDFLPEYGQGTDGL